jgi:membrane protein
MNEPNTMESSSDLAVRAINNTRLVLIWLTYFIRTSFSQFVHHRGLQMSSSLAYTTLLSIVPLIAVMFSFFGNLPVFKDINEIIQDFVFSNFVPAFGQTVREYLINYSYKASQLTAAGIIALVLIAILMMSTIDSALNNIWNVTTKRNPIARFLIYWAILTLGPILVGIGFYSTSYLLALPLIDTWDSSLHLKAKLLTYIPFFTTTLAFTLMYTLIPNCHVNRRYALIGGISAAILFEVAKFIFGAYVKAVPTYQMIYGALAVMPMFLIWIYLSWVIVLFGAQIAYSLSVFRMEKGGQKATHTHWDFFDAYHIIAELWQAQNKGNYLSAFELRRSGIKISHLLINEILSLLKNKNWITHNESDKWILSRDMNEVTLLDLYKLLPCKLPTTINDPSDHWQLTLSDTINKNSQGQQEALAVKLGALLRQPEK